MKFLLRSPSDHDGTYVTIHSGYDHSKSFTRDVWNYKRANYDLMKSKIKEVNWYELIYKATEINTACKNFTDNFMGICKLCIPSPKKITREDAKIWFDSSTFLLFSNIIYYLMILCLSNFHFFPCKAFP
jgi:hypothetical protein